MIDHILAGLWLPLLLVGPYVGLYAGFRLARVLERRRSRRIAAKIRPTVE